ncbi:MAG TPA: NADPH-dependent F420 reductase [Anaerolineales bacterium]
MSEPSPLPRIAVLGGTGAEGKGLAYRWAQAGYPILIGSRSRDKAAAAALEIVQMLDGAPPVLGMINLDAAQQADIVVLTVPYAAHAETLWSVKSALHGKILVDVTVPLVPPKVTKAQMPPAGSAAQEAQAILGEGAEVAAAFHNVSYKLLLQGAIVDSEVLVTGTSKPTRIEVLKLVKAAGLVGWDAGPLENSVVAEALTSVLIHINKVYGSTYAGIRITGVKQS